MKVVFRTMHFQVLLMVQKSSLTRYEHIPLFTKVLYIPGGLFGNSSINPSINRMSVSVGSCDVSSRGKLDFRDPQLIPRMPIAETPPKLDR